MIQSTKPLGQLAALTVVLILMQTGCRLTREPVRYRDDFFKPISVLPKRNHSVPAAAERFQVNHQLEPAAKGTINVPNSFASPRRYSNAVIGQESIGVPIIRSNTTPQRDAANLQIKNKKSSPQFLELRTQLIASNAVRASSMIIPASVSPPFLNEYAEGLLFFKLRHYRTARNIFRRLLAKGIEEDIADNCEYWIGECQFASRKYTDAVFQFQKVLSIESSNKKVDAYYMLGKSYERTGDVERALITYEELNERFPDNNHALKAKHRLNVLKCARRTDP